MSKPFDLMAHAEGGGAASQPGRRSKGSSTLVTDRWSHGTAADSGAPPPQRSPRLSGSSTGALAQKFESQQAERPAPVRLGEVEATSSRKSTSDLRAQFEGGGAQPASPSKSPSEKRVVAKAEVVSKAANGGEATSNSIADNPFMKRDSETRQLESVSNQKVGLWKLMQAFKGMQPCCLQKRK